VADPVENGLQSVDPELALLLNSIADDSNINAAIVFHRGVNDSDISQLQQLGILGGTRFRVLPAVIVSATRDQLLAVSRLPQVRSIYGNRTLKFDADPYFNITGLPRANSDADLRSGNGGLPYTGRNVTVAVLDTGLNALHPDLNGKVVQNVKLADVQGLPVGFHYPAPLQNLPDTDLLGGHGTLVGGIIGGSGAASNGKYAGVAPGASLLGLSAGDASLMFVLAGFDYLLDRGPSYGVRVVNCSFSASTIFDVNDPVNVATKMLTDRGVNVVFSAGNSGSGNGTLNPYAAAPWVISVGATDQNGVLAPYSSRGNFGNPLQHPTLVAPGTNIAGPRSLIGVTAAGGLTGADLQRLTLFELPYYTTASGTSFSAPQVSGAVALILEADPTLTPAEIRDIISRTATPLPKYFYHEVGAGMLNTHAAVLDAAFPERHMGDFRSLLSRNALRFVTRTTQMFDQIVTPGSASTTAINLPPDTVQATVSISWGSSANDFGLKVNNHANTLLGESNLLNLPLLTGRREKVSLRNPAMQNLQAVVRHTANIGTQQRIFGAVEVTQIEYPALNDLAGLPESLLDEAETSLVANLLLPAGSKFRPYWSVTRAEFAEAMVRGGFVPQYIASSPMFLDVRDHYTRTAVESVQSNPGGRIFIDAPAGQRFYPYSPTTRLAAAIAFVKAAKLEHLVSTTLLPATVADAVSVPQQWRGYLAVALNEGFISLDANRIDPQRSITRLELAVALNGLVDR
jgi:serine protease AprX